VCWPSEGLCWPGRRTEPAATPTATSRPFPLPVRTIACPASASPALSPPRESGTLGERDPRVPQPRETDTRSSPRRRCGRCARGRKRPVWTRPKTGSRADGKTGQGKARQGSGAGAGVTFSPHQCVRCHIHGVSCPWPAVTMMLTVLLGCEIRTGRADVRAWASPPAKRRRLVGGTKVPGCEPG
jgi:hypothetical protein